MGDILSEKRFTIDDDGIYDTQEEKHFKFIAYDWMECDIYECCEKLNEQQATITSLKDENLYNNFKLKSVDDLKKLKDIFEICMILIDGAITDEDLELGYESVFQFERRIKKFNGDLNE